MDYINFYKILSLSAQSNWNDIENAYKRMLRELRSDNFMESKVKVEEKKFLLHEIYYILGDSTKRFDYDKQLALVWRGVKIEKTCGESFYDILGVQMDASQEEIERAYKQIVNSIDESKEGKDKLDLLYEVYMILQNQRDDYNIYLQEGRESFSNTQVFDDRFFDMDLEDLDTYRVNSKIYYDLYKRAQVSRDSSQEEIEEAYNKMVIEKYDAESLKQKEKDEDNLELVYSVLRDKDNRMEYDDYLKDRSLYTIDLYFINFYTFLGFPHKLNQEGVKEFFIYIYFLFLKNIRDEQNHDAFFLIHEILYILIDSDKRVAYDQELANVFNRFDDNMYKILGVDKKASQEEIDIAYKKRCLEWNLDNLVADKSVKEEAERNIVILEEIYNSLQDKERRYYDKYLSEEQGCSKNTSGFFGENFYEILGVKKDASPDEIKKAYQEICDSIGDSYDYDMRVEKGLILNAIYSVLKDQNMRYAYDVYLSFDRYKCYNTLGFFGNNYYEAFGLAIDDDSQMINYCYSSHIESHSLGNFPRRELLDYHIYCVLFDQDTRREYDYFFRYDRTKRGCSNYYKILGLSKISSYEEVSRAYKKEVIKYNPDNFVDPQDKIMAQDRLDLLHEIYENLINEDSCTISTVYDGNLVFLLQDFIRNEKLGEDYYQILGVKAGASQEEVQEAYNKRLLEWSPDNAKTKQDKVMSEEKIFVLNYIYSYIDTQDKRNQYDALATEAIRVSNTEFMQGDYSVGYYEILGVNAGASQEEIKKSYKKRLVEWNINNFISDKYQERAELLLVILDEAYSTLGNKFYRYKYDLKNSLHNWWNNSIIGQLYSVINLIIHKVYHFISILFVILFIIVFVYNIIYTLWFRV